MSFEDGIKMWREEVGQYYDEHFSEEEMEILYDIVRGCLLYTSDAADE